MHFVRRRVLAAAIAGSMVAGGAIGATVFSAGSSVAANTAATTQGAPAPPNGPSADGRFHPNENTAHEGKESKQREAQEDAGQFPTVP
jgi:Cu/Zn superoxide dismutase